MTLKQERFITAYLETGNATKSAIIAGYSAKNASEIGYSLLQHKDVKERIEKALKQERKNALMTRNERRKFWEKIMTDESNKLQDRLKASELLAKSYGDFDSAVIERERLKELTAEERETEQRNDKIIFVKETH